MPAIRFPAAVLSVFLYQSEASAATHTWKGGGGDNFWSNDDNWIGGAPENDEPGGAVLIFPPGAQSHVTVCDESYFYVQKMIFLGSYTVKHTDNGDDNIFGINNNTGDALVLDSSAAPTVVFDASTKYQMLDPGVIRIVSGTLRMQGEFSAGGQVELTGAGALWLEGSGGASGDFEITGGTVYLASPPNSNSPPFPGYVPFSFLIWHDGALRVVEDDQLEKSPVTVSGGLFQFDAGAEDVVGPLEVQNGGWVRAETPGSALHLGDRVRALSTSNKISGHVLLGGVTREIMVDNNSALEIYGWIEDGTGLGNGPPTTTGGIRKTGGGYLVINADGYYHGPVVVETGMLWPWKDTAFGAAGGGVSVGPEGTLKLQGSQVTGETLTVAGALVAAYDSTWSGNIVLENTAKPIPVNPGNTLTVFGAISGPGALITYGGGTLDLSGNSSNTHTGGTTLRGGVLKLSKFAGNAVPGTLTIDSLSVAGDARVVLNGDHQIADTSIVQLLDTGAVLDLASHNETIGSLSSYGTGDPEVRLGNSRTSSAVFTIGTNHYSTAFLGRITGADTMTLQKAGNGVLTLGAQHNLNTYDGQTRVLGGTLVVQEPQVIGHTVVNTGATLSGTGTAGLVTLGGGNLHASQLSTGNVTPNLSGGKVLADLLSTGSGGNDQLNVTGTVNLTGVSLLAALGFQPQTGSKFVIIRNDGTDAVTGQFTGLGEGGNLNVNGKPFSISYQGGDGNDVELRYLGTGGQMRILTMSYNRVLDRIHLEALAPPGVLCRWQVSGNLNGWSTFATGVPDAAGILKLDQELGLQAPRMFFRLVQP